MYYEKSHSEKRRLTVGTSLLFANRVVLDLILRGNLFLSLVANILIKNLNMSMNYID